MQSENGENKFTLQENGDLVITCKGLVIWASSTWQLSLTNRVEGLYFSAEGNVMLYKEDKSLCGDCVVNKNKLQISNRPQNRRQW